MARGGRRSGKEASRFLSDEEKEGVTRCICGKKHSNGLMIQCEECKVWQHCACVNIYDKSIPSKYFCELCQVTFDTAQITRTENRKMVEKKDSTPHGDSNSNLCKRYKNQSSKDYTLSSDKTPSNAPIKIRLNVSEKEDWHYSLGNNKADKLSPQEFTTKRGRKTTRITYNTYSEEERETHLEANTLASSVSPAAPASPNRNKFTDELLSDIPKKRKHKEKIRKLGSDSSKLSSKKMISTPSPIQEAQCPPMVAYQKVVFPKLPHENSDDRGSLYNNEWYTPPVILSSKYEAPALLIRSVSPPPKPKNISSKISIREMNKRVKAMQLYIETHQSQLKEYIKSVPEVYKAQKQHYSTSTKMAKELLHNIDSFYEKYGGL